MIDMLAKLIPRLASEHDGEVVATVRAMQRVLTTHGKDWHDFVRMVHAPRADSNPYPYTPWPRAEPAKPAKPTPSAALKRYNAMAQQLFENFEHRLRDGEHGFVKGMRFHDKELSEKQASWLKKIYARFYDED